MRKKVRKIIKERAVSVLLSLAMFVTSVPVQTFAQDKPQDIFRIAENGMTQDILDSDVFYMSSSMARMDENSDTRYYLRIGRGGDCSSASSVNVKIADLTAKYGTDYEISLLGSDEKVYNPDDNESLLERMEGQDYDETPVISDDELTEKFTENSQLQQDAVETINDTIKYIEDSAGLSQDNGEESQAESTVSGETISTNPLQQARTSFTGVYGEPQSVTSSQDTYSQIQKIADVLTTAVVGANIKVDFAKGVDSRIIVIDIKNNNIGDGDRYFYLMLSDPEGSTTISSASSFAGTIVDDEEQADSEVSFGDYTFNEAGDTLTVEIKREGAINSIADVQLTTEEISAQAGRDFSPVDMSVTFPMGIDKRTINIPVCKDYITKDSEFLLKLKSNYKANISDDEKTVTLTPDAADEPEEQSSETSILAASNFRSLSTVKYANSISLTSAVDNSSDDHMTGSNGWTGNEWKLEWVGGNGWTRFWYNYKGATGVEFRLGGYDSCFEYAGTKVRWARCGSCATITVGFEGEEGLKNSTARQPGNNIEYTSTRGWSGEETMDIYSSITDPVYVNFINRGNCDDCNRFFLREVTPIYRPFLIKLQQAEPMKFLQEDGSYKADDGTATYLALDGANNNTNNEVVLFADETLTLKQTIGKNISTPYTYLSKLTTTDGYNFAEFENDGYTSYSKKLTAQYINDNSAWNNTKMFKYYDNTYYYNPYGTSGKYGKYGTVTLKPEFGYKTSKIKVNVPSQNYGYFNISNTDEKLDNTTTLEYHMGDTIQLSTKMYDEYSELYEPAGYKVSYKYNESDTSWVKENVIVPYDEFGKSYLDDNRRLRYGYYEITPLFQLKNNAVIVRVPADSVSNFDTEYGIFNTQYVNTTTIDGKEYKDYVVYNDPDCGKIYSLSARVADWNDDYTGGCVWKSPDSKEDYAGDVFYMEASNNAENNIIQLDYVSKKAEDMPYHEITGNICRPTYNMTTKQVGYSNILGVKDALVTFGGSFAVTDENGDFTVPAFRAISGMSIRYIISINGETIIKELKLNDSSKGSNKEITYTVDSTVKTEEVFLVENNAGQILINTENGSIINNIQVWAENSNYSGYSIVADSTQPVTMKVRCVAPVDYTKSTVDADGTIKDEAAKENLKAVDFVVYDAYTNKELKTIAAEYDSATDTFSAQMEASSMLPGNRLYMRVTTDRANTKYLKYDSDGNLIDTVNDADMEQTTYSDVFTGYTFSQKTTEDMPAPEQQVSPLDNMNFVSLPLVGDSGFNFDFPFVSVAIEKTASGYRMSIGVSPLQIADTVKNTHLTKYAGPAGTYYKDMFSIKHPFNTFKNGIKESFSHITALTEIGRSGKEAAKQAASALGAPTWRFDMQFGVYMEFTYMELTNGETGYKYTEAIFTGVGGYIGVSGGFRMAWYTILPVVFLPAYFGIDIEASILAYFGAATDVSKPRITYEDASNATVDFDNSLGDFNASVKMAASVQVYVGIGLAGVLGLRGGGSVNIMGLYEPSTVQNVDDWGCMITFKAGIWIDLFLFTVPLQYTFPEIKFGSFKQFADASQTVSSKAMENAGFRLREAYSDNESVWLPPETSVMSAFSESSSYTLESDAYEHPDVQILKLSDGTVFMAFLDSDSSKDELERTVLKYSVYKDGKWSNPVAVQNDGTADFQPSICAMNDGKVMISWLSSDPADEKSGEAADYLSYLEVYTAVVDYDAETPVSEITRLTTDEYYDYLPISVYDDVTGDRAVYFVKTASTGSAEEMSNSYTNDCVVTYMIYSDPENSGQGRWLFDYYYDDEVANEEDKAELIKNWHGQRFLSSPIPEMGLDVPNISDFTATSYNGLAVYAYTIDSDSSNDTAYDKELFLQFYDFETHKTYVPVRITNDNVSDAVPQLIRVGEGENATTKLFWYRNEKQVAYVDVTDLVRYGLDDNGNIKEDYLTKDDETGLESLYSYVDTDSEGTESYRSMADFKAVVDGEDIYIVWTQAADISDEADTAAQADDEIEDTICREVFATAMIQADEDSNNSGNTDEDDVTGSIGCSWASPYRLTYTDAYTDEPNVVIDADGNMMVVYNQYNQEYTEDENNPVIITDFDLRASYLEPSGAVDVTDITLSDTTPVEGETVTAGIDIKNNGLKYAEGFTVNVYATKGDEQELIYTIDSDDKLTPGQVVHYSVDWTAPEAVEGYKITTDSYEKGGDWTNHSYNDSEEFLKRAEFDVDKVDTWQDAGKFYVSCDVTNIGNAASVNTDSYNVSLVGPYFDTTDYTKEECELSKVTLEGIEVGETKNYVMELDTSSKMFEKYGYIECFGVVLDKSGDYRTDGDSIRVQAASPVNYKLNGKDIDESNSITVKEGETLELNLSCEPVSLSSDMQVKFASEDNNVAEVSGTTVIAVKEGTTTLKGYVSPYGDSLPEIKVIVEKNSGNTKTDAPSVTDKPTVSDEPVVTDKPTVSDEPAVTDKPSATDESAVTAKPSATDEPSKTAQAAVTDKPSLSQNPQTTASGNGSSDNKTDSKSAKTGDDSQIMLWILLMLAGGSGFVYTRRKRKAAGR